MRVSPSVRIGRLESPAASLYAARVRGEFVVSVQRAGAEPALPPGHAPRPHTLVLERGRIDRRYWLDLWNYRELFAILAWRDVAVRYKQTAIGIAWAALRPLLTMVVMTVVFHVIA